MPDKMLTVEDFAAAVKRKYPDYAEVDDYDLTHRYLKKHPVYAESVTFGPRERAYAASARAGISRDIADDFLNVTGGIESGNAHRWKNGKVKESPRDPKDGQVAVGFSQIKPGTIKKYGLDPYDEDQNIEGGLRYFAEGGSDPVARRLRYFGGPKGGVQSYRRTGKIPKGGDFTGTSYDRYVKATMPKPSPLGDARYGVQPNSSFEQAPISDVVQPVTAEDLPPKVSDSAPIIPDNIPPEMTADPMATRPRRASAPTPEDMPIGSLGEIRAKGPDYEGKFYDFVHRNAPAGTKGATAGKAADQNLAKVFLQITDFLDKNPNASPKDVNRGFAQLGAEFLRDPSTRGSQLPRALHEAMLSAKYTPDEWAQIPGKLQAQIRAHRPVTARLPAARKATIDAAGVSDQDISWHYGMTLKEFQGLSAKQQQTVVTTTREAIAGDEEKKKQGVKLEPSLDYINANRGALGLQPKSIMSLQGLPRQDDQGGSSYDPRTLFSQVTAPPPSPQKEEAKRIAATAPKSFFGRLLPAEANRFAAKIERAVAGLADYAEMLPHPGREEGAPSLTAQISGYLKNRAHIAEMASEYETPDVEDSLPKSIVKAIADMGVDVGSLIVATRVSGLPFPVVMAGEAALINSDQPKAEIAKQVAIAYGLGKAYEYLPGKIASKLGVEGQVATRVLGASLFSTAGVGQTAYEGGDTKEIISQGIAQAGMGAMGGPHKGKGKGARPPRETPVPAETQVKLQEGENARTKPILDEGRSSDKPHQASAAVGRTVGEGGGAPSVRASGKPAEGRIAPKEEALPRSEDVAETTAPTSSVREGEKPLTTKEASSAFQKLIRSADRGDINNVLDNWQEARLNDAGDGIVLRNKFRRNTSSGEGPSYRAKREDFISWLASDGPFDTKVYGKEILKDAEWRHQIESLREAAGVQSRQPSPQVEVVKPSREEARQEREAAFQLPFIKPDDPGSTHRLNRTIDVVFESESGRQMTKTMTIKARQKQLEKKQKVMSKLLDCLHG